MWLPSHRADPYAVAIADRHYNRQKPGTPQFMPPGSCVVFKSYDPPAVWGTSWPMAEFVQHAWAGAWINSIFRKEGPGLASGMIRAAVAHTCYEWPDVPPLGMVTFVDPEKVKPVYRRGKAIYGYSYLMAGFEHVGYTKGGLWTWQLLPERMPEATPLDGAQLELFELVLAPALLEHR
jgi:hypothetical protein